MQRGQGNDELGGIAEGRVEKPPDSLAHALRKLLRCPAHPPRQRQNSNGRSGEDEEMPLRSEHFQSNRNRNEKQEPVHHNRHPPASVKGLRSSQSTQSTGWVAR